MGALTHEQIVTEAVELAGNTGLTARAQVWLGLILRELMEKSPLAIIGAGSLSNTPFSPTTVAAGVTNVVVGGTAVGNTTRGIRRAWICTNGQTDFTEVYVEHMTTMDMPMQAYNGVSGVARGRPTRMIVQGSDPDSNASVKVWFDPCPDKTYALWFVTEGFITAQGAYNASFVSVYPNDLTIVQGLYAMCLKHQADERFGAEWGEFLRMQREDRGRYMSLNNSNTRMRLSPRTFAPRRRGSSPWDWMGPK